MEEIRKQAQQAADDFLNNEKQYRLGFIEAEQSNPITKTLGQTFRKDTEAGVRMLLQVDAALAQTFASVVESENFLLLKKQIAQTLTGGGRILLSGCGSSGRLSFAAEACWRVAIQKMMGKYPQLKQYEDRVQTIMTGGDFTIIRSVESFEDSTVVSEHQTRLFQPSAADLLIGVTATAETTSIIGTALEALRWGSRVFMVVCTDPQSVIGKLKRVDDVFLHKNTSYLYIPCGGMAVTGSTRMQSSSVEQLAITVAMELVLQDLILDLDPRFEAKKPSDYAQSFIRTVELLQEPAVVERLHRQIEIEQNLYENDGHVTYYTDKYLLDVLTDTTERGPTFSVPYFRGQKETHMPLSWAYVKTPTMSTKDAWDYCFKRAPRCLPFDSADYASMGISSEVLQKMPDIRYENLLEFQIGLERDEEREKGHSYALWLGLEDDIPDAFYEQTTRYSGRGIMTFGDVCARLPESMLDIFQHIAIKLLINVFSTGTMARMGRISGNYMINMEISNKKLVDRATRIVAELANVSYEQAIFELYYSAAFMKANGISGSSVRYTLERLCEDESVSGQRL